MNHDDTFDWIGECGKLEKINAELLEACQGLIERANSVQAQSLGARGYSDPYLDDAIKKAQQAISNAERRSKNA